MAMHLHNRLRKDWLLTPLLLLSLLLAPSLSSLAQERLSGRSDVEAFLDEMAKRHTLDRKVLAEQFMGITIDAKVIQLIQPVPPGERSWQTWKANHLDPLRIREGRRFRAARRAKLLEAQQATGFPPQSITAILGIESNYGATKGDFPTLRTLATLTFGTPEWSADYRAQLVDFLLLAREQGKDPASFSGSYAGALGYPQFLPTSWRRFGRDGDGDGTVDLINTIDDAIFSVGNFLRHYGWTAGSPIAIPVRLPSRKAHELRSAPNADKPNLSMEQLRDAGVEPLSGQLIREPAILVDLPTPGKPTEYWVGYPNFYALMEYNRLFFYAMAVQQLSEAIAAP